VRRTKTKGENCGGTGGSRHNERIARLGGDPEKPGTGGVENSRPMLALIIYFVNSIYGIGFREMANLFEWSGKKKKTKG